MILLTFARAYIWCNHMSGLGSSANPWGDRSSRWQLACHLARTIGRTTQLTPSDPRHSDIVWSNKGILFCPPKKRDSLLCNNRLIQDVAPEPELWVSLWNHKEGFENCKGKSKGHKNTIGWSLMILNQDLSKGREGSRVTLQDSARAS